MKIIGGSAGGRPLKTPSGDETRPTSSLVRESMFNILGSPSETTTVLDLFAGTGSLGFEALSRGAQYACFVDSSPKAFSSIQRNAITLNMNDQCAIYKSTMFSAVHTLMQENRQFDWIFADPPYHKAMAQKTLKTLSKTTLLKPDGTCIIEHDKRQDMPSDLASLIQYDQRIYGDTAISFYKHSNHALN